MTRRPVVILACVVGLAGAAILLQSVVPLRSNESAMIAQGRQSVRLVNASGDDPGLYLKAPFVETAVRFDRRVQVLSDVLHDVRTGGGGWADLTVDGFYRVVDPSKFFSAAGTDGSSALAKSLETEVMAAAAHTPTGADGALETSRMDAAGIGRRLERRFGIMLQGLTVVESGEVQAADRLRADARRAAEEVRTAADLRRQAAAGELARDAAAIRNEGERRAFEIRGDGDADRAAILADAYGQDPDFARFFRRLEAYDQALDPSDTTLVLSPETAFLNLFGHGPAAPGVVRR